MYFTTLYEKYDTTGQMKDIRLPVEKKERKWSPVHLAQSWLLFLHEESVWKNFESNIAWSVDELHQTFWFEQFFNSKLCCKIRDLLCVPIIFFWLVGSVLSLDECLIKTNYGQFCVCFRCLEKVILWSHLCLTKNEFRYHH